MGLYLGEHSIPKVGAGFCQVSSEQLVKRHSCKQSSVDGAVPGGAPHPPGGLVCPSRLERA